MTAAEIDAVAREVLGITLTASQQAALAEVSAGRDTLAVLPTGSGKSAIYQVGGLVLGGLTVVISPLIALQRDQLRALATRRRNGRQIGVALLNATQHVSERSSVLEELSRGTVDFLLLGPEQLANPQTNAELLATTRPVTLLAVDEAHLVSEWGHDFRPEYLRLAETATALGRPPILALTATAAPPVQADITRVLGLRNPAVVVADFDRPNIALAVRRAPVHQPEEQSIADRTVEVVLEHDRPALVYAMSHARCEDISERLQKVAFKAAAYHAGLSAARRAQIQQDYFAGALDVVVATSAFGMGIDKPDVRTVVHAGVPAGLDEYYQEIGRAGRDRKPADAVLVYDPRTLRIPRLFAARSRIPTARVGAVLAALIASPAPVAVADLVQASAVPRPTVDRILAELEELGFARVENDTVVATGTLATAEHRDRRRRPPAPGGARRSNRLDAPLRRDGQLPAGRTAGLLR